MYITCCALYAYMCVCAYMGWEGRMGTTKVGKDFKEVERNGIHVKQKERDYLEKERGSAKERKDR